ncbi:hypothetical protein D3C83_79770 [compost metagenome]
MSPTIVNSTPVIIPAPMPCNPRKAISCPMPSNGRNARLPAAPHSAEASTNTITPLMKNGLRPKRSDRLAKIGTETVDDSR